MPLHQEDSFVSLDNKPIETIATSAKDKHIPYRQVNGKTAGNPSDLKNA